MIGEASTPNNNKHPRATSEAILRREIPAFSGEAWRNFHAFPLRKRRCLSEASFRLFQEKSENFSFGTGAGNLSFLFRFSFCCQKEKWKESANKHPPCPLQKGEKPIYRGFVKTPSTASNGQLTYCISTPMRWKQFQKSASTRSTPGVWFVNRGIKC